MLYVCFGRAILSALTGSTGDSNHLIQPDSVPGRQPRAALALAKAFKRGASPKASRAPRWPNNRLKTCPLQVAPLPHPQQKNRPRLFPPTAPTTPLNPPETSLKFAAPNHPRAYYLGRTPWKRECVRPPYPPIQQTSNKMCLKKQQQQQLCFRKMGKRLVGQKVWH